MDFIEFIKDAIEKDKKVIMRSISETDKTISDGETEFQLTLSEDLKFNLKTNKNALKYKKFITYNVSGGFENVDTGYKITKLNGKNYFYITTEDGEGNLLFTDFRFNLDESIVIFLNLPPDENDKNIVYKELKRNKRNTWITIIMLPILLGFGIYLIVAILATIAGN